MRKNKILSCIGVALLYCITILGCGEQPAAKRKDYTIHRHDGMIDIVPVKNHITPDGLNDATTVFYESIRQYQKEMKNRQPVIELPEEYQAISKDSTKPDNLTGYYKNDTLFIQFK